MARITDNRAMVTGNQRSFCAQRMSGSHAQAICGTYACAATSSIFTQTGAVASVSLFVLLVSLLSIRLENTAIPGLVGVLSILALSGLTGLAVAGAVGLSKELTQRTQTGDER